MNLLKENGGCRLPCWWGFTPGETAWQVAENFFLSHGKRIGEYRDSQTTIYSLDFHIPLLGSQINQDYYTIDGDTIDVIALAAVPPVYDGEYTYGDDQYAEDFKPYMLPQILKHYGQPAQALLETFSSTPEWLPFYLLLFYPDQGILIEYHGPIGEKGRLFDLVEGEKIRICPWRSEVDLWLWSPERPMALEHVAQIGSSTIGDISGFRSLKEATGMNVEQFYQSFVQPNNKICLETPADMW